MVLMLMTSRLVFVPMQALMLKKLNQVWMVFRKLEKVTSLF